MNTDKNDLRLATIRKYILHVIWDGVHKAISSVGALLRLEAVMLLLAFVLGTRLLALIFNAPRGAAALSAPLYLMLWGAALVALLYWTGHIPGAWAIYRDLVRIGMVNSAGEAPIPTKISTLKNGIQTITFYSKGFPLSAWNDSKDKIQTALNLFILGIAEGDDLRTIRIYAVPGSGAMPTNVDWKPEYLPAEDFVLALGESPAGQATIDLAKLPHLLIGAATGMGKTVLLKSIIFQCSEKGASVIIADWKGGVDYDSDFRSRCKFVSEEAGLLEVLTEMQTELERRKALFLDAECANITEYNEKTGTTLKRQILVLDETSMILDTTGRSKEDKETIYEILNGLNAIGRLGRAFGLHLILSTQRPDVTSIPGSLKAQLDGRLCGHTADAQSSMVVLDGGIAAKLPATPGRFILRDGSGSDTVFQAYHL